MALGKNMKIDRLIPLTNEVSKEVTSDEVKSEVSEELRVTSEEIPVVTSSPVTPDSSLITPSPVTPDSSLVTQYADVETEDLKMVFTPSKRKTQRKILIAIEGNLTINNVELLYSKVNDVFENYDHVDITLTNITDIDLTVVQLFHVIRVNYYPQNKFIYINAEFNKDDRKLLNTCGFTEFQTQKVAG
jgi:hypothetical protein